MCLEQNALFSFHQAFLIRLLENGHSNVSTCFDEDINDIAGAVSHGRPLAVRLLLCSLIVLYHPSTADMADMAKFLVHR